MINFKMIGKNILKLSSAHKRNSGPVVVLIALLITFLASSRILEVETAEQLNCTGYPDICPKVCNEPPGGLNYTGTFCDPHSGSCVCDCRDVLKEECTKTPFTPCFQDCVRKNPNPEAYLYTGGNCPVNEGGPEGVREPHNLQCACECKQRDDYYQTNDVY